MFLPIILLSIIFEFSFEMWPVYVRPLTPPAFKFLDVADDLIFVSCALLDPARVAVAGRVAVLFCADTPGAI